MDLKSTDELTKEGALFETVAIPNDVHTVEDVERACNCTKPEVIKTLLFVGSKPVVALMTGDKKVDIDKLRKAQNDETLRMADKDQVSEITGFAVGTVSPFGLPGVVIIADKAVKDLDSLIMGSGKSDVLIRMSQAEFLKSFRGSFIPLAL